MTIENCAIFRWNMLNFGGRYLHITTSSAVGLNPLDLHALSTSPAFILSQDQTLKINHYLINQEMIL